MPLSGRVLHRAPLRPPASPDACMRAPASRPLAAHLQRCCSRRDHFPASPPLCRLKTGSPRRPGARFTPPRGGARLASEHTPAGPTPSCSVLGATASPAPSNPRALRGRKKPVAKQPVTKQPGCLPMAASAGARCRALRLPAWHRPAHAPASSTRPRQPAPAPVGAAALISLTPYRRAPLPPAAPNHRVTPRQSRIATPAVPRQTHLPNFLVLVPPHGVKLEGPLVVDTVPNH